MIKILRLALALGAAALVAFAEPATIVATEPVRLAEPQLDLVTAGGVLVTVQASASSSGSFASATTTSTLTDADASQFIEVGTGKGSAYASACCGWTSEAMATVDTAGSGDVVVAQSVSVTQGDETSTESKASGSVIAVTLPGVTFGELVPILTTSSFTKLP